MRVVTRLLTLFLILTLSACGGVEWDGGPQVGRASSGQSSAGAFAGANRVRVVSGDTLYGIAQRRRVSLRALIEANGLTPPYVIRAGAWLNLPRGHEYTVKRGDTLFGIAGRHQTNPYDVARLNGLTPPYLIRPGERLLLPKRERTRKARRAASRAPPIRQTRIKPPAAAGTPLPKSARKSVSRAIKPKNQASIAKRPGPGHVRPPKSFSWPVSGKLISRFGAKQKGLFNDGINLSAPRGTPVLAAAPGTVAYVGNELRGFGNLVLVKHAGGWVSAYAHADRLLVRRGQRVRAGDKIATVGTSGNVARPQLHFELRKGRRAVDPLPLLGNRAAALRKDYGRELAYFNLAWPSETSNFSHQT